MLALAYSFGLGQESLGGSAGKHAREHALELVALPEPRFIVPAWRMQGCWGLGEVVRGGGKSATHIVTC